KGNGIRRIEFVAKDVPAVGYKTYSLKPGPNAAPASTEKGTTLENQHYRVEIDPDSGAVKSIYDKDLKKELVETKSPYRFGQYLSVSGGAKDPNGLLKIRVEPPNPKRKIHQVENEKLVSAKKTAYGWHAVLESSADNTPKITTEIRLFENEKKIEFIEDVSKK